MDSSNSVIKAFIAGSCSGTCSAILFQPLDLVKTRLQTSLPIATNLAGGSPTLLRPGSLISCMGHILQKEQLTGLWRGVTPSIARCVPGVGLYFSSLHFLSSNLIEGSPGPLQAISLGIVARSFSGICLIPLTVVKTRYESGVYQYNSMVHAVKSIYRSEGIRGLTCGLVPTLLRDAPFSGIYLMFYTQAKNVATHGGHIEKHPIVNYSCGIVAGLLASAATQPADVIKTKMQLYPKTFASIHEVVLYVYQKYGPMGFFKGLSPRILRRSLMAATTWTVYEQVSKKLSL
ncbi:Mitochondrial glycine transporter [Frankliniella fusca]|uniref:Mitochondrial glycine transporter n=1 Tax=Frankliniella fusca TaxID=407009 RepID=A0AAE1GX34_9NEOP|nr:Mitochondrial glycine transporter [Frankliniella fusca]